MICANCGANNPPASAYCGGCGAALAPKPEVAASPVVPEQANPVAAPFEPQTPQAVVFPNENAPTLRANPPMEQPQVAASTAEDAPTLRAAPQEAVPQTPQPTPSASEFFNFGASTPQEAPGANAPQPPAQAYPGAAYQPQPPAPAAPGIAYPSQPQAPGFSSGAYPAQTPLPGTPSGTYPAQMPSSGAAYPPQTPLPGTPSGVYQPQTPAPGFSSGAYPQSTSGADFPAGVYPAPGGFSSGGYDTTSPMPGGQVSGVYPQAYPGQPSQPGWGAYPGMAPAPVQKEPSRLIKPMPLWAFISSIVVVVVVLAALFFFTGADWAAGAQFAGVVALVIGALILVAFGVRAGLGMLAQTNTHRRSQIVSALLLALLLFAFGGIGLGMQMSIHSVQAHFLEGQQKWQTAITEYQDGGQNAPVSEDIARTYNEWGEQLFSQQQYSAAIDKFSTVISNYTGATTGVTRAEKDAIAAYQGWGNQAVQQQNYSDATQHFDALLNATYCDSFCQQQTSKLDATAYYNLAEQQLNKQAYATAVSAFNQLTTHFGNSPEAQRAHGDFAKALWGEGQQQLSATCSTAVSTYQQLSSQFSDTPEGQQAANALKQPQPVKGHFTSNIPGGSEVPAVGLVQGVTRNTPSSQFYAVLAKSPVQLVKKDGTFLFPSVKQGTYDMVWGTVNTSTGAEVFYVGQQYPATVGPLCAFDFGDINESFPVA